jgi:hypothetical protein
MGESRLLKGMRSGVLSPLSFTDNNDVGYFNQAWLSKATDVVEGRKEKIN